MYEISTLGTALLSMKNTDTSKRLEPLRMAVDDMHVPLAGIAAVAIHDERDMLRNGACRKDAKCDGLCVLVEHLGPPR